MSTTLADVEQKVEQKKPLTTEDEQVLRQADTAPPEGYNKGLSPVEVPPMEESAAKTAVPPSDTAKPKDEAKPKETPKPDAVEDTFTRLERELAKPEGQEDLKQFTDRERAYFHQMRRDRKARQKAEEDRDAALHREITLKQQMKTGKSAEAAGDPPAEDTDPLADLRKKDPTDFLTVKEVVSLMEKVTAKPAAPAKKTTDGVRLRFLKMCDEEARRTHPDDYDAVMELTHELVDPNEGYLVKVAEAIDAGENPAEVMYTLIKSDPEFAKLFPVAQTRVAARKSSADAGTKAPAASPAKSPEEVRKEADAERAQQALEANTNRTKTTGHAGAHEERPAGELTMEDITKMSDREFAKLPKATREKYLRLYG